MFDYDLLQQTQSQLCIIKESAKPSNPRASLSKSKGLLQKDLHNDVDQGFKQTLKSC